MPDDIDGVHIPQDKSGDEHSQEWWQPDELDQLAAHVGGADEGEEGEEVAAGERPIPEEAPEGAPGQRQEEEPGEALRDGALGGTRQPTRPADETQSFFTGESSVLLWGIFNGGNGVTSRSSRFDCRNFLHDAAGRVGEAASRSHDVLFLDSCYRYAMSYGPFLPHCGLQTTETKR